MENKNTISVVLPIKSGKARNFEDYFNKCITSVKNQKDFVNELVIVYCDETDLTDHINSYDFEGLNVVKISNWAHLNFASPTNTTLKFIFGEFLCETNFQCKLK